MLRKFEVYYKYEISKKNEFIINMKFLKKSEYSIIETDLEETSIFTSIIGSWNYCFNKTIIGVGSTIEKNEIEKLHLNAITYLQEETDICYNELNQQTLTEYIYESEQMCLSAYIAKITEHPKKWNNMIIILILSRLLNINIHLYVDNSKNENLYSLHSSYGQPNIIKRIILYKKKTAVDINVNYSYLIPFSYFTDLKYVYETMDSNQNALSIKNYNKQTKQSNKLRFITIK